GGSVRADTISRVIAAVVGVGGDPGPPTPGLRIGGGLAAAVLLLVSVGPCWLGHGVRRVHLLDAVAPPAGLAIALGRLGCLAEGCCFGVPCDWPWCIRWPAGSPSWWSQVALGRIADRAAEALPAHPYPLYLAGGALVATALSRRAGRAIGRGGATAFAFAALLAATRLAAEPMRERAFGQGAAGQGTLDLATLAGSIALLACVAYRETPDGGRSPTRQASSPSPGMPSPCTSLPSSGSSNAGRRPKRRQVRQASAEERTRTG
ncbi:MAG: prolipoprotein diacylglyceryl transferase family protein, partial [Alphaproteobacteria bacterium]